MSGRDYFRPIVQVGPGRPEHAQSLAGGPAWFAHVEVLGRGRKSAIIPIHEVPREIQANLLNPRRRVTDMNMQNPQVMGILNATPDSFSDGGKHHDPSDAIAAGIAMVKAGADLLDIGGESTRPGAETVPYEEEIRRTEPIIKGLRAAGITVPISIDTRKTSVASNAIAAGATIVNDVSGFTYDAALAGYVADAGVPVCVMHALGDPKTMQKNPQYDDVLLDVYDFLEQQVAMLGKLSILRNDIFADPGIGFGKTQAHNLALLSRISLFHSLGTPILLGASRKKFIGNIGGATLAKDRAAGSIGVALAALNHGVQVLRVHDVAETVQAIALWRAATLGKVI